MDDYIKRDHVINALNKLCDRVCQYSKAQRNVMCSACPLGDAFTVIEDDLPASDVRENMRGEWVERKDIYTRKPDGEITSWEYKCSRCNQLAQLKYNFCFNCGADMRGEKDV